MSTWEHGAPHPHESSLGQCRGPEQLVGSLAKRRRHHKSLLVPAKSSVKVVGGVSRAFVKNKNI